MNVHDSQAEKRKQHAEKLYEQYGKPLEKKYKGKYIAVSESGKTILADTLIDAMKQGVKQLGRGNFVFKLGEKAVGQWL